MTLYLPVLYGTSNATTFTLTGFPAALNAPDSNMPVPIANNDVQGIGVAKPPSGGVVTIFRDVAGTAFTASGVKVLWGPTITYLLS